MDVGGAGINDVFAEFESFWLGSEIEGDQYLPAEEAFFRDIVSGVVRDQNKLDPLIDDALSRGWPLQRIEAILRAVMRAGAYELEHRKDIPGRVVVFGICRRRACLRRRRRDRHGQCGARPDRPAVSRGRVFARRTLTMSAGSNASGEDTLIARYFRPLATDPGAFGLTDDAAVLKADGEDIVVTTDAIVEGVHFLPTIPGHHRAQGAAGEPVRPRRQGRSAGRLCADAGAADT